MIKKHYTGMERRAENIIWNAAGKYDFDPPFMAFFENGRVDLYFNMVIGLAIKWLDMEKLGAFFERYAGYHKAEEFDELLWLGIENCVYEKEVPERPVLLKIRRARAEEFYKTRQTLSRQQMMLQSMLVYDQQEARWAAVLGKRQELPGPRGEAMKEALAFPGNLDTDGVISRMEEFLKRFFRYTVPEAGEGGKGTKADPFSRKTLKRLLHRESHYRDTLMVRNGSLEGDIEGAAQVAHAVGEMKNIRDYETDLAYIRQSLGESIISEQDLRTLENNLCRGGHAKCRLWVTGVRSGQQRTEDGSSAGQQGTEDRSSAGQQGAGYGSPAESERAEEASVAKRQNDPARAAENSRSDRRRELSITMTGRDAADLERVQRDSAAQAGKNRTWMKEHSQLVASSIRRLSARVDEVLSSYEQALPEEAKAGALRSDIAWRLPVLQDPDVFLRAGEETERSVSVDLLLDASASRLNYQEQLAAEATIIAKSLMACRVPVQVECFRSLRGFTVLQILKDRKERNCDHIADYFAGGWNRDGLGIRLASEFLPEKSDGSTRILLTLTDASPNDSTRVPAENGGLLEHEYQGRTAVLDTKQAVDGLKKNGVKIGAVFLGPTLYMENLHTIYGTDAVRIHRVEQLEEAAAALLDQIMREQISVSRVSRERAG